MVTCLVLLMLVCGLYKAGAWALKFGLANPSVVRGLLGR